MEQKIIIIPKTKFGVIHIEVENDQMEIVAVTRNKYPITYKGFDLWKYCHTFAIYKNGKRYIGYGENHFNENGYMKTNADITFSEVEFSITGLCNRTCVFCPRVDPKMYPNVNEHLSLKFYTKILNDLKTINYFGRISFSGFGEPLLHPDLLNLVTKTKEVLPDCWLDIISNGDRVDVKKMRELYNAGLSTLLISMYDGPEQIPVFEKMISDSQVPEDWVILRKRYLPPEDGYGMNLTNRAGTVTVEESNVTMISEPMQHPCFYTHYRMMIDYTGEVLLCSHDWG